MQRITNWISEESDEIGISIYDQSTGKASPAIGKQSFSRNGEILELHLLHNQTWSSSNQINLISSFLLRT